MRVVGLLTVTERLRDTVGTAGLELLLAVLVAASVSERVDLGVVVVVGAPVLDFDVDTLVEGDAVSDGVASRDGDCVGT